ncbi:MAG: hypothetical protein M9920_08895 [Verrucomicrobiae bacterium]|nr:hypothetical protein [Verrucomicrobiae bacterium]
MSELEHRLRVLFVCTQNKVRSLTAEHLYSVRPDLRVKSCGTANFAARQLTPELMQWAEIIFVFDQSQIDAIDQRFDLETLDKPVISLGMADIYKYKSDALVLKLITKLDPYLGRPNASKRPRHSVRRLEKLLAAKQPAEAADTVMEKFLTAVGVRRKRSLLVKSN